MIRTCVLIIAAMTAFAVSARAAPNPSDPEKKWRFEGKAGVVEVKLTSYNNHGITVSSLEIYAPDGTPRSVTEEAQFLATVLDDFPKVGVNIHSLDQISFRFSEPEAIKKVAIDAASSKQWRGALKTNRASVINPLVTSFLNESHAYQEWDSVFKKYGLTIRVAGVEEVIVEPFSKLGISCPAATDCSNLSVPGDAFVQMDIKPNGIH